MPDGNASPAAIIFRLPADFVKIHTRRVEVEIQMEVDIDVIMPGEFENASDLALWIIIRVWAAANDIGTSLQRLDKKLIGSRIIEQSFLRENANLEVYRP